jgi:hypothetical protein
MTGETCSTALLAKPLGAFFRRLYHTKKSMNHESTVLVFRL